jgi:ribosomal protein L27
MSAVRKVGVELVAEGEIVVRQQGQVVDPKTVRGPIRYGQANSAAGERGEEETFRK